MSIGGKTVLVATLLCTTIGIGIESMDFSKQALKWLDGQLYRRASVVEGEVVYLTQEGRTFVLNFFTQELRPEPYLGNLLGVVDGHLVAMRDDIQNTPYFLQGADGRLADKPLFKAGQVGEAIADYQNGQFFVAEARVTGEDSETYIPFLFDLGKGKVEQLGPEADVVESNPDRNFLLFWRWPSFYLWNIRERRIVKELDGGYWAGKNNAHFLTNRLIITTPPREEKGDGNRWRIYTMEGVLLGTFLFTVEGDLATELIFSRDLRRAVVGSYMKNGGGNTRTALVDTTDFRDWVKSLGVWFDPTTGTCIDIEVRVRQYPNLEAKTLGFLTKGEALEILDRSGVKQTIGPYGNNWWYQVKRKDGTVGWSYGAFLEVKGEKKE